MPNVRILLTPTSLPRPSSLGVRLHHTAQHYLLQRSEGPEVPGGGEEHHLLEVRETELVVDLCPNFDLMDLSCLTTGESKRR